MPTFSQLPRGRWRVQVRRERTYKAATFDKKRDALDWAREVEGQAKLVTISGDTPPPATSTLAGLIGNSKSVSTAFTRACTALGIEDLHLHDLRHRATVDLFGQGLDVPRVALMTGHKTWTMLKRYTNIKPADVQATAAANTANVVKLPAKKREARWAATRAAGALLHMKAGLLPAVSAPADPCHNVNQWRARHDLRKE